MSQLHHHGHEGFVKADAVVSFNEHAQLAERIPPHPSNRFPCFKIESQERVEDADVCPSFSSCESLESFLVRAENEHWYRRDPFAPR